MRLILSLALIQALLWLPAEAGTASFRVFEGPEPGTWANFALSQDGDVMACNYGGEIYLWSEGSGFRHLGTGHSLSVGIGISGDGTTVCATRTGDGDGFRNPAVWSDSRGWLDLGHIPAGCVVDDSWGSGFDLNRDGSVAVGLARYCTGGEGFRWTRQSGMVGLAHPPNGGSSRATTVSADGTVIAGFYEHPVSGHRRPARWQADGSLDLYAGEEATGEALDISSDGSLIVGSGMRDHADEASYWTADTGVVYLGSLSGETWDPSVATDVTDDGTIYGHSGDSWWGIAEAFVWTQEDGMRRLQDVLVDAGAEIPQDIWLTGVLSVSADGSRLVGSWRNRMFNEGQWMVTIEEATSATLASLRAATDGSTIELVYSVEPLVAPARLELTGSSSGRRWTVPLTRHDHRLVGLDTAAAPDQGSLVTYSLYHTEDGRRRLLSSQAFRIESDASLTSQLTGTLHAADDARTTFVFDLDRPSHVTATVVDQAGRRVAELADRPFVAGQQRLVWNGARSGHTFLHLDID